MIKEIIKDVCEYTGVQVDFSRRYNHHSETKFIIYKVLNLLGHSCSDIARLLKRDHATIMWGVRKAKEKKELLDISNLFYQKYKGEEVNIQYPRVIKANVARLFNQGLTIKEIYEIIPENIEKIIGEFRENNKIIKVPDYKKNICKEKIIT